MENQTQSPVCAELDTKVFNSLVGNDTTNSQKCCALSPVYMSQCGKMHRCRSQLVCINVCFEHMAVHKALFVPLLLGLLMKESNWIFELVLGRAGEGGAVQTSWREGRQGGQTCGLDYCALYSPALSSQGRGLLSVWAGRLVRESISWVQLVKIKARSRKAIQILFWMRMLNG